MLDEGEAQRLGEVLREAERVLDHQVRALEELDDKIEQVLALSFGVALGAFALAAFMVGKTPRWGFFVLALAAGGIWNLASLLCLTRGYGVVDREIQAQVGPSTRWLADRAEDAQWALADHYRLVVGAIHNSFDANDQMALFASDQRRKGVRWLLAAVVVYVATITVFLILV